MGKTGLKRTDNADLIDEAVKIRSNKAFTALYTRYSIHVMSYISSLVPDVTEAEDILMETFEKAFKQIHTYSASTGAFSTWIFRIARNTAYDHKDRQQAISNNMEKAPLDHGNVDKIDVPDESLGPEDNVIDEEIRSNLTRCIDGLPEMYRGPARLALLENLGYQEIAETLDLPLNTVKTRIRRAKEKITKEMEEDDNN